MLSELIVGLDNIQYFFSLPKVDINLTSLLYTILKVLGYPLTKF